ncbi:anthranilate synthase component I family protein [Paenibacillus sp. GSMTC-2017]|uniref:anthranilate synthase component I family protein n=1 Tax=Paenibacillus sp. GSMTC-2017 TaxID=2794350 RepID=UPI0018D76635|nr:anthranilate synthase component I family protein [Paenibacillus sp. GSMTC-2017]MBH5320676.1 anthranilate synthase component I family protein [Paenibacillus sp. GSMTC-2017]
MITTWEEWVQWRAEGKYTTLPLIKELPLQVEAGGNITSWEEVWQDASPHAFVLESGKDGRFTYLGIHPESIISGKGMEAESVSFQPLEEQSPARKKWQGKPLDVVRTWMSDGYGPRLHDKDGPKWLGGCVGFWSYDIIRTIERLPELAADDTGLPDYLFLRMNELWIVDHTKSVVYCVVHSPVAKDASDDELRSVYEQALSRLEGMSDYWLTWFEDDRARASADKLKASRLSLMEKDSLHIDVETISGITSPTSREMYMDAVRTIQNYIGQGDVFQVNLSQRQARELTTTPEELYEWLRLVNPSPYMGFLRCPDFQLVSASPELLVELSNGRLITRPIAGTRRRGRTEEEDQRFADELRTNEKERAEHIMLVDLERNDLGRISTYGSVEVKELMVIENYSHVMHLVSQVEGELAGGKDAYDVIAATFPGGTITGAPKIRTMEIIEELEPVRRGAYTGSLGWIDYNGDMEFNIIIRTMTVRDGQVHIQAGAGIVIDSDPEREYSESLSKAKALWKAIQYSERFSEVNSVK